MNGKFHSLRTGLTGGAILAIRKGTPCSSGKGADIKSGACFFDQGNRQGSPPVSCATPQDKKGNPISILSGNKYAQESFYQGSDPFPVKLELVYNSLDRQWRHNYSTTLHETSSALVVVFADGRSAGYDKQTGVPINGSELSRLERIADGWVHYSHGGEQTFFNASGRVVRITFPGRGTVELSYSPATIIRYQYNGRNYTQSQRNIKVKGKTQELMVVERDQARVVSASVDDSRFYFDWDVSLMRLSEVSFRSSQTSDLQSRKYHYESIYGSQLLTGITDERGVRYSTWTYDPQGRATSSEHSSGADKVSIIYSNDDSSTVINPLGQRTVYRFADFGGVRRITAIEGEPSPNCSSSNSIFTYDERGLLKTRIDNKGNRTTYEYNSRGLEVSRTEASGTPQARTVTTAWHPELFLPVTITEPDRITQYTYDSQGRQTSQSITQR
ncbi:DUF6531 domain-containing protein [Ectopseudomonas mendocina]|nr:DUF6531 domain-containing protein [Pseudomonas mendocina]